MQQGTLQIGTDTVVILDRHTKQKTIQFTWKNHDIFTEIDVYLIRNNKSRMLITSNLSPGVQTVDINGNTVLPNTPSGRFVAVPGKTYIVRYTFCHADHVKPYNKKYPIFKFRIEMVGNPSVYAESNEFKVI